MPWIDVDEPHASPPRSTGPLTAPGPDGVVDLEDRWGSVIEAELDGEIDLGACAQVEIRGSVLRGATVRGDGSVELDVTATTFVDCDLSAVRFTRLTNTRFEGCKLSGVDLGGGLVRDVVLERTTLRLSTLRMTELERVAFVDSTLDDVDAYEASLSHVTFPGTVLRDVDLDRSRFDRVDLRGANEIDIRSCRRFDGCLLSADQLVGLVHLFAEAAGVAVERPNDDPGGL